MFQYSRSIEWKCPECGSIKSMLKPVTEASKKTTEEAKELASQINFQVRQILIESVTYGPVASHYTIITLSIAEITEAVRSKPCDGV